MSAPSARGLFRATGNKSKPVVQLNLDGEPERVAHLEREVEDFYPTPPEPTRALLAAESSRLKDFPLLWEPAAGDGAMVREMRAAGHQVVASDLIDRGCGAMVKSFYDFDAPLARAIVTNPPFADCNKDPGWIRHAMGTLGVDYMALLLPMTWLGAAGRARLWVDHPPARIYLMRWRIDFTGQGAPPQINAWMIWDWAYQGETVLRMLDRIDSAQAEMFAGAA